MSDYVSQTIDVYDSIADSFAKQAINYSPKAQLEYFCSLVKKGGRVLDIGCGSGRDCAYFVKKGFETVGVDLSEKLLEIARSNVPKAIFLKQDIRDLSFPPNLFDGIWSCASLLHISHKEIPKTLKSWFTVCKPQGILLIYVKKGIGEEEREEPSVIGVKRFYSLFTKELLTQYCQQVGFTIVTCFDVIKDLNIYNGKESLPWICCIAKKDMNKYFLTEIETTDKLIHQGIYFEPSKKSGIAILWIHGLSSTYSSHVPTCDAFADICEKYHFGFAAFNNRGAKFIDGIQKRDPSDPKSYIHVQGGAGNEKFEECIFDIDAGVSFLLKHGYKKIILVGRSTGANKVCFYAGTVDDPRVSGVVLMSPISDRLGMIKSRLSYMKEKITSGKGDVPIFGFHFFPITPKRYISLFEKGSKEDVFDYGDKHPKMTTFAKIKKPLYVVFGGNDEHADRSVAKIKKVFNAHTTSKTYRSTIVPGALHGFDGMEKELARRVCDWIDCTMKLC